ncbi:MAG: 3-isopropylmalate dehydratase [Deltaproteobacteria bacterium]|uniref:aconitase family protein n=1 Tax=Desulfobacula sp. TaxID=2593537 RepID=UPI00198713F6|nr:3-isopropylmalate dehydratase [Candidatus Desulfobacula maris]MBL6992457.1 3-isopropylmalate dehydratase [Desulfobacula sp.]
MTDFFYQQLAKASNRKKVSPGEKISVKIDLALAHDGTGPEILKNFNGPFIMDHGQEKSGCSRILFTLDHCFPAPTIEAREFQRDMVVFAKQHGIRLFKNGEGVLHQVVAEEEKLWPGMIIIGADGHVATAGAFGAIGFSVSAKEFANKMLAGSHTMVVPEQIIISLEGNMKNNVMARDIAMHIVHNYGKEIKNKAVLLTGNTIDLLSTSEKMSVCNFLPEGGVATALVLPQKEIRQGEIKQGETKKGEAAQIDIAINAQEIMPMVAVPGNPPIFTRPSALMSQEITVAIAGGCSSGRLEDMKIIAGILKKNKVHPDVTFIITPGSRKIMESMDKLSISSILRSAGAIIMPPGCGPCPGKHFGVLCDNDIAITTTISNKPGRIGAQGAKIYLASPMTVALSAVTGKIIEPG